MRVPRFIFSLVVLFVTGGFASQAGATAVLTDGGFESPAAGSVYNGSLGDGWSVTSPGGQVAIFNSAGGFGSVPHTGTQVAYFGYGVLNTLSQTLTTVVGQQYLVSYWIADSGADTWAVNFGSQNLFTGTAPTNGIADPSNYVNFNFLATATSTNTVLSFSGQRTTTGFGTLLDDVNVTAVPEPATIGLTVLSGLAMFALRGRVGRDGGR